jgi:ABC-2 type transport system permease protein
MPLCDPPVVAEVPTETTRHPVPRPGAVGGSWRRLGELVWLLAVTDFRRRFAQTALGRLWLVIGPLLFFGVVYLFVSEIIERLVGVVPNFAVLLLLNLSLYTFFRNGAGNGMTSLTGGGGLVRKMPMPRLALPAATILSAGFVLAGNLVVTVIWIVASGVDPRWTWLLLPVLLLWLVVVTSSFALLVSGVYVFLRDVSQIWGVIGRIGFYVSPILYPIQVVPKKVLYDALSFNPLAPVFAQTQTWLINAQAPSWFGSKGWGVMAFMPFIVLAVISVAGVLTFRQGARRVAEQL